MDSSDERPDEPPRDRPVPVRAVPGWLLPPVIGSLRQHRGRWTIAWYSVAVAVIAVLTTILVWPHPPNAAERRVRDFLSAVQHGQVARARGMVDAGGDKADTSFLTADVARQNWQVDAVRSIDPIDDYSYQVRVDATLSVPNGDTASYRFTAELDGAKWKVLDPYVYVDVMDFPLPYVAINGHRVELPHRDGETATSMTYTLFPGVYRFFDTAPDSVRHPTAAHLLMPGSYALMQAGDDYYGGDGNIVVPRMTLTGAAQRSAQRAVDAYLDGCAKSMTKLVEPGCPFGAEYVPEPGHPDRIFADDEVKSATWKVTTYPVVTVQPSGGEFLVVERRAGVAKLTVTGTDRDTGFTAKTSMSCEMGRDVLRVDVTGSGKLRVYPDGGRYGMAHVDRDPFHWETC